MKIYAIIGQSQQTVLADNTTYSPAPNEVLMNEERPEGNYIATEDGTWQEFTPVEEPTIEEQIEALKAENETLNDTLLGVFELLDNL